MFILQVVFYILQVTIVFRCEKTFYWVGKIFPLPAECYVQLLN